MDETFNAGASPGGLTAKNKRKRSEKTRRRIMEAGRKIFMEKGYHDTRISDIIAETGLGHGTFWIYFRNKEDLLRVLVQELLEDFLETNIYRETIAGELDISDIQQIQSALSRILKIFEDNRALHQVILEAAIQSEEFAKTYEQINRDLAGLLEQYLARLLPPDKPRQFNLYTLSLILVTSIAFNSFLWTRGFMRTTREDFVYHLALLAQRAMQG